MKELSMKENKDGDLFLEGEGRISVMLVFHTESIMEAQHGEMNT